MRRLLVTLLAASCALGAAQEPAVNQDALVLAAVDKRLKDYVAERQQLEAALPPLAREATPDRIEHHRRGLATLVQKARRSAARGDIFAPAARALIRRSLARVMAGPGGAALKAAILEDGPGAIRLEINGRYPQGAPRSTVPPQVLAVLPRLPDALEYRFLGDRLVLVDVHADVVLDVVENALPR